MAFSIALPTWARIVLTITLLDSVCSSSRGVSLFSIQTSVDLPQQTLYHPEDGDCSPLEVHLALADDDSQVRVMWRTRSLGCSSSVQYGRKQVRDLGEVPKLLSVGTSDQITENLMCAPPAKAKKFRVILHNALLSSLVIVVSGLEAIATGMPWLNSYMQVPNACSRKFVSEPNTEYWYQVEGDDTTYAFTSPRRIGSDSQFSFIAFGDMGETKYKEHKSPMASATLAAIQREHQSSPVDFILHMGDLAYADGKYKVWDSFMESIMPVASTVPYMIGVGNHEYDYTEGTENDPSGAKPYHPDWGNYGGESGGECGAMTAHRFLMPMTNSVDNAPFWYSFDYGTVHFTIISTEHDISPGSRQHKWLQRDLATIDRCKTPWVVVGMHRPMYVVYPHKDNRVVGEHLRDSLEDLFMEYDVDLTISGHVHSYYRTCVVYNEKCREREDKGITHFIIGTGGHKLSSVEDDQRAWCAEAVQNYGFGRFTVDGDQIRMQFVLSSDRSIADEVVVRSKVAPGSSCGERSQLHMSASI